MPVPNSNTRSDPGNPLETKWPWWSILDLHPWFWFLRLLFWIKAMRLSLHEISSFLDHEGIVLGSFRNSFLKNLAPAKTVSILMKTVDQEFYLFSIQVRLLGSWYRIYPENPKNPFSGVIMAFSDKNYIMYVVSVLTHQRVFLLHVAVTVARCYRCSFFRLFELLKGVADGWSVAIHPGEERTKSGVADC